MTYIDLGKDGLPSHESSYVSRKLKKLRAEKRENEEQSIVKTAASVTALCFVHAYIESRTFADESVFIAGSIVAFSEAAALISKCVRKTKCGESITAVGQKINKLRNKPRIVTLTREELTGDPKFSKKALKNSSVTRKSYITNIQVALACLTASVITIALKFAKEEETVERIKSTVIVLSPVIKYAVDAVVWNRYSDEERVFALKNIPFGYVLKFPALRYGCARARHRDNFTNTVDYIQINAKRHGSIKCFKKSHTFISNKPQDTFLDCKLCKTEKYTHAEETRNGSNCICCHGDPDKFEGSVELNRESCSEKMKKWYTPSYRKNNIIVDCKAPLRRGGREYDDAATDVCGACGDCVQCNIDTFVLVEDDGTHVSYYERGLLKKLFNGEPWIETYHAQ
jgi:hypothetical protein